MSVLIVWHIPYTHLKCMCICSWIRKKYYFLLWASILNCTQDFAKTFLPEKITFLSVFQNFSIFPLHSRRLSELGLFLALIRVKILKRMIELDWAESSYQKAKQKPKQRKRFWYWHIHILKLKQGNLNSL